MKVEGVARDAVYRGIDNYQDDPNLQNLIDQVQLVRVCCATVHTAGVFSQHHTHFCSPALHVLWV